MNQGLKECWNAPQVPTSSSEPLNDMNLFIQEETLSDSSKSLFPVRSGYNSSLQKRRNVRKYNVFVLGVDKKPLTPTTNSKARKLMKGQQAKPIWNKFNQFGIQMLVTTRKEVPKTVLGIDFGTKFEGYTVSTDKENNLAVMWKLPDKKKLVKKLEERRRLRRARRQRNCRRRKCRFQNRKETFIAPSQKQVIDSRLRCIKQLVKCYAFTNVVLEDVKFNHKKFRYGKNFTTVEIGKTIIDNFFISRGIKIDKFEGYKTQELRKKYGYHKIHSDKSKIDFRTHCSDALAISTEVIGNYIQPTNNFIYADDNYRCIRRRLHDSQYSKGNIRYPFSRGNFKGIRKGTLCELGIMAGGTKKYAYIYNLNNKRIEKSLKKIQWLSHHYKTYGGNKWLKYK